MDRDSGFQWHRVSSSGIQVDDAGDQWWSGTVRSLLPRSDGRVILGTETSGVWVTDEDGSTALPLSSSWDRPEVSSLTFGPDGEGHIFAGGSRLYVTDPSSLLPLLDWHEVGSFAALNQPVLALAVLDQPRRIVVAGAAAVMWADIPAVPGTAPWTDTFVWNWAGSPTVPTSIAIASRDQNLRTRPSGIQDTTVVVGGDQGGIWIGDWRTGSLNFTPAVLRGVQGTSMKTTLVAVCDRVPSRLYACCSIPNKGTLLVVLRSDDGGDSWDVCGYSLVEINDLIEFLGDTGPYHSCIAVHPSQPEKVAIGWKGGPAYSTNSGANWKRPAGEIHPDKHAIAFSGQRIYVGCDGGVFSTDNLGDSYRSTWNRNLPTLQCYSSDGARQSWGGMGVSKTIPGIVATGTQDNGNVYAKLGDSYRPLTGADGGFCAVLTELPCVLTVLSLQSDPSPIVAHLWDQGARGFARSFEPKIIKAGPGQTVGEPLRAPLCVEAVIRPRLQGHSPHIHAVATVGHNLYGLLGGDIKLGGTGWGSTGIDGWQYLGSAPEDLWAAGSYNGDVVYVGTGSGRLFAIDLGGGPPFEFGFTPVTPSPGVIHRIVQRRDLSAFAISRTNIGSIIHNTGELAWRTVFDPGETIWAFEVCDTANGSVLVAATESHTYSSYDDGLRWHIAADGLPRNPMCADLRYTNEHNRLFLSTYGWSIWSADVPSKPPPPPTIPHAENLPAELKRQLDLAQRFWNAGQRAESATVAEEGFRIYLDLAATDLDGSSPVVAAQLNELSEYMTPETAWKTSEAATAIYRLLSEHDPTQRPNYADSLLKLAVKRQAAADVVSGMPGADEPIRQASQLYDQLLDATGILGKTGDKAHQILAQALTALSERLWAAGGQSAALISGEKASTIYQQLIQNDLEMYGPPFVTWLVSQSGHERGATLLAGAKADAEKAVEVCRQLVQLNQDKYQPLLVEALTTLIEGEWAAGDQAAASTDSPNGQEAVRNYQQLIQNDLETYGLPFVKWLELQSGHERGVPALLAGAKADAEKAVGVCQQLVQLNQDKYQPLLAEALATLDLVPPA